VIMFNMAVHVFHILRLVQTADVLCHDYKGSYFYETARMQV
jgi:hypothetical protein